MHNRTKNDGCPFCNGKRGCQHNSIAFKAPNVAASWDSTASDGTPHDFTANSNFTKQWHCPVCGHKWLASISHRVGLKSVCPGCYNLRSARTKVRHPTLAECNHPLLKEWDTEANAKEGLFPDKLRLGSNKRVHWTCRKCPLGLTHKWAATMNSRALAGNGCSCCAGRTACSAILCQACILESLKNGITARMMGILVTIQLALMLWCGGSQETKRVGSNLFLLAQITASSGTETEQLDM